MRKQTKVVAVASAAALLAIGGAMTSFAAQGWVEEDGTWYFYDKDGNRVEDQWKKSGDNWFWLDGEDGGAMATDMLVEDDDDTYYDAAHYSGSLLSVLVQRLLLHHHTLVAAVLRSLSIADLLYILLIFLGRSSIGLAGYIVAELGIVADETGA